MKHNIEKKLADALWRIYHRPDRPTAWAGGGNLPWNEPAFAERMLREHLDQSHGAASRTDHERLLQIDWLWEKLGLQPGMHLCDITCGPGLYAVEFARRGCYVTGVDFSPAAIAHARTLAEEHDVADRCTFIEGDVRDVQLPNTAYDGAIFIYGQLAVFPPEEAQMLLEKACGTLKPGGRLCVELLDQEVVDKSHSTWWYTDESGLWGDAPFLHLGERFWDADAAMSLERFYIIHLETGESAEVLLCDQTYASTTMAEMMQRAGFSQVDLYPHWDQLPLYDRKEWHVYIAHK